MSSFEAADADLDLDALVPQPAAERVTKPSGPKIHSGYDNDTTNSSSVVVATEQEEPVALKQEEPMVAPEQEELPKMTSAWGRPVSYDVNGNHNGEHIVLNECTRMIRDEAMRRRYLDERFKKMFGTERPFVPDTQAEQGTASASNTSA